MAEAETQTPTQTSPPKPMVITARQAGNFGVVDFTELGDFPEEFRPLVEDSIESLAKAIGMACKTRRELINGGETTWWVQVFEGRLRSSFKEKMRALTGAVNEIHRSAKNKPRRKRTVRPRCQCRSSSIGEVQA